MGTFTMLLYGTQNEKWGGNRKKNRDNTIIFTTPLNCFKNKNKKQTKRELKRKKKQ